MTLLSGNLTADGMFLTPGMSAVVFPGERAAFSGSAEVMVAWAPCRGGAPSRGGAPPRGGRQMTKLYLGIDVGGTSIKSGVVDEGARILSRERLPSRRTLTPFRTRSRA